MFSLSKILSLGVLTLCVIQANSGYAAILSGEKFASSDAVLVTREDGQRLFSWQAEQLLIPASLSKLATAYLAINKWGLDHRYHTDFFWQDGSLWVKGYGDPFLVSEEFDLIASQLASRIPVTEIASIRIDPSHFDIRKVPGRSLVSDPYNAPLSAVSANFNTAKLRKGVKGPESAEPQTPLTATAIRLAGQLRKDTERVNLINAANAQTNFAELLAAKLGIASPKVYINQSVPTSLPAVYTHSNSRSLADVLRGTLEFSNNFMANQVFLQLGDTVPHRFATARQAAEIGLASDLGFKGHVLKEGSGLSRDNRLSAEQIDVLLKTLSPNKGLLKKYDSDRAVIHAKTGTLDGVRSYAGYVDFPDASYRFVFVFNRNVPWRYREQLLDKLVTQLAAL